MSRGCAGEASPGSPKTRFTPEAEAEVKTAVSHADDDGSGDDEFNGGDDDDDVHDDGNGSVDDEYTDEDDGGDDEDDGGDDDGAGDDVHGDDDGSSDDEYDDEDEDGDGEKKATAKKTKRKATNAMPKMMAMKMAMMTSRCTRFEAHGLMARLATTNRH